MTAFLTGIRRPLWITLHNLPGPVIFMLKLYLNLCWNNYICIDEWMFISFHWHWYSIVDIKRATAWQNQQNDLCAQWRLRPAWSSAQSDQSSLCTHWVAKGPRFLWADSEDSDQTGQLPSLRWAHRPFVGFVMLRIKCFKTEAESCSCIFC